MIEVLRFNAIYKTDKAYTDNKFRLDLYVEEKKDIMHIKKNKNSILGKPLIVGFKSQLEKIVFQADYYDSGKYNNYYKLQLLISDNEAIEADTATFLSEAVKVSIKVDEVEQGVRESLITTKQNNLIHALISDISESMGYMSVQACKMDLKATYSDDTGEELDTLAGITKKEAKLFIDWLFDIVVSNGVNLKMDIKQLYNDLDMIEKYVVKCLQNRVCCISGKPNADIHHFEQLGHQAKNYDDKEHLCLPLDRVYHNEIHSQYGKQEFLDKYHIKPVPLKFAKGVYTIEEIQADIENHNKTKNKIEKAHKPKERGNKKW
jgi:hypothetical protein